MKRADLPGPDAPSAEVLDELLRAFSADNTDAATLQRIDLTSPEVDELISGSPAMAPRPAPAPEVEPADEAHDGAVEGGGVGLYDGAEDTLVEVPLAEPAADEPAAHHGVEADRRPNRWSPSRSPSSRSPSGRHPPSRRPTPRRQPPPGRPS